uniref:Ig-like domain-containing protein n=1 Tax=Pygocentrus nattereri TaxID=42514 RepID=A0AAR2KX87_PYGNA
GAAELLCFAGDSGVTQSPTVLWVEKGNSAEINCSHNKDASYFQMYWFRQQQGKPMELIVFTTTATKDFGSFDQNKFSAIKENTESGSFTVKNVESDDSTLYFCAVSKHSDIVLLHC